MSISRLSLALAAITLTAAAAMTSPWRSAESEAVENAVRDYVEAFYHAKPELLERSVSKDLKKMGYWRKPDSDTYSDAMHMNFEQAVALSNKWNNEGQQGSDLKFEITVFDVMDKTACAKVDASWGMDYFQLVRENDRWMIHHVLWQSYPPTTPAGE